ncbi:unnamed protein product, partial [marine sediment metagenome]
NKTTKKMDWKKIERLTKKNFSFMDIILLYQAELNGCDYFVTEDEKLRFSKEIKNNFKVKVCCVNELKEKLKRRN